MNPNSLERRLAEETSQYVKNIKTSETQLLTSSTFSTFMDQYDLPAYTSPITSQSLNGFQRPLILIMESNQLISSSSNFNQIQGSNKNKIISKRLASLLFASFMSILLGVLSLPSGEISALAIGLLTGIISFLIGWKPLKNE